MLENEGKAVLSQIEGSQENRKKRKAVLSLNNPIVRLHLGSRSLFLREDEIALEMEQHKVKAMIQVLKILIRNKVCTYYERQRSGTIIPCNNNYDYKRIQPDEELNVYFLYVNLCSVICLSVSLEIDS